MVDLYNTITGVKPASVLTGPSNAYVDVRDVARAVVFCATEPAKAGGQRFLLCGPKANNQTFANILREAFPERKDVIAEGEPDKAVGDGYKFGDNEPSFDGETYVQISGLEYTPLEKTVVDTAEWLKPWLKE